MVGYGRRVRALLLGSTRSLSHSTITRSATGHSLQLFGVPSPLHSDLRRGALDLAEIVRRELDGSCADVLVQALQIPGARYRDDPRLLGKQPSQRDLGGRRLIPGCDFAEQIDQGLVRLPGLRREAG